VIPVESFYASCVRQGIGFWTGVPDSLLKDLCAYITDHVPGRQHVIAANEGGAVGLAAGFYLATERPALVYLQNSGLGNAVNPLLSLVDADVYGIPLLFLVGWRGEPDIHDEPQHVKQGRVTMGMLEAMEIPCEILMMDPAAVDSQIEKMLALARRRKGPVALLVRKGTFEKYRMEKGVENPYSLCREEVIAQIATQLSPQAVVIATTGHISRELYECRTRQASGHSRDFLMVGSMGHASQIALGIALAKPEREVYCLDGDGAVLMHMGALPIIGQSRCENIRHIVLNNGAHVSVGGQPTVAFSISLERIAAASGYVYAQSVDSEEQLGRALDAMRQVAGPAFLEVRISERARTDIARPVGTPAESGRAFMQVLQSSTPPAP